MIFQSCVEEEKNKRSSILYLFIFKKNISNKDKRKTIMNDKTFLFLMIISTLIHHLVRHRESKTKTAVTCLISFNWIIHHHHHNTTSTKIITKFVLYFKISRERERDSMFRSICSSFIADIHLTIDEYISQFLHYVV